MWAKSDRDSEISPLNVLFERRLLEVLAGFLAVVLNEIIDDVLLESQFDRDVLAEEKLALKYVLVGEDQVNARHEILEFLLD